MDRRNFCKHSAIAASGITLFPSRSVLGNGLFQNRSLGISGLKKPLAIAMWDYSWILRHHRYGEFEDWDKVLEGLAERGYNAIRMDVMPQYVAADANGKITDEFRAVKKDWTPIKWGNDFSMNFRPREALLKFLPKCKKYGIKVGLATWFMQQGGLRKLFMEEDGLYRAWSETLDFLKQNKLLDENIIYIDLLNEYPFWHGYDWLKKELDARGDIRQFKLNNPNANIPDDFVITKEERFNPLQKQFYNEFASNLIHKLRSQYPEYPFHFSLDSGMKPDKIDLSHFGALDYHVWFANSGKLPYLKELGNIDQSKDNRIIYRDFLEVWKQKKAGMISCMDDKIKNISETARQYNIPCGNTEGWGAVFWQDHPDVDWQFIKEAAEICVDLAKGHDNYKFICTSNFTHPQFKGMWEDIKWHRRLTARITS
jgi:hypothetical protein